MQNYKIERTLGQGSYGVVYLVKRKSTGKESVMKMIDYRKGGGLESTMKEVEVLKSLNHPCIIQYEDCFLEGRMCHIVMEYADGGDLSNSIAKRCAFSLEQILDWVCQICLAVKHIHDRKILHRDIKPHNIFLTKDGRIKIGDFGVSRVLQETLDKAKTKIGTPLYLSPEICESRDYDDKSDIFSLGVVFYEMMALRPPFSGGNLQQLLANISKCKVKPLPKRITSNLRRLVDWMLQKNPYDRPSINEVLQLKFLKERVSKFLQDDLLEAEFSHTVIHSEKSSADENILPPEPPNLTSFSEGDDVIVFSESQQCWKRAKVHAIEGDCVYIIYAEVDKCKWVKNDPSVIRLEPSAVKPANALDPLSTSDAEEESDTISEPEPQIMQPAEIRIPQQSVPPSFKSPTKPPKSEKTKQILERRRKKQEDKLRELEQMYERQERDFGERKQRKRQNDIQSRLAEQEKQRKRDSADRMRQRELKRMKEEEQRKLKCQERIDMVREKREEARKEFQRLRKEARRNKERYQKQMHEPQIEIFGGETLREQKQKEKKPPEKRANAEAVVIPKEKPSKAAPAEGIDYAKLYREMRREARRNKENALKQMREPQVQIIDSPKVEVSEVKNEEKLAEKSESECKEQKKEEPKLDYAEIAREFRRQTKLNRARADAMRDNVRKDTPLEKVEVERPSEAVSEKKVEADAGSKEEAGGQEDSIQFFNPNKPVEKIVVEPVLMLPKKRAVASPKKQSVKKEEISRAEVKEKISILKKKQEQRKSQTSASGVEDTFDKNFKQKSIQLHMDMLRDYLQKGLGCGLLLRLYKELSVFLKEDPSEKLQDEISERIMLFLPEGKERFIGKVYELVALEAKFGDLEHLID